MDSFVLQTSDSDIQNGEVLGRLGFAANEADTGDARAISAVVSAMAEAPFTSTSNPTSIVFATAFDGDATNKLRITSSGNFLPFVSGIYDIGSDTLPFRKVFTDELRVGDYNFPTSDGSTGQVLSTDGAGQLSFIPVTSASDTFIDSLDFNTSTNVLTIGRNDGVDFTETINAGGGTIDGGGTANYVAKWVDGDTLTSGIIYDNGSQVGIGENTPAYKLDVDGMGRFQSGIIVPSNTILAKANPNIQLNGPDLYDGWLIAHVSDCYGVGNNNNDGLLIEKRDGNGTVPDGGIIFANRGMNGNSIPSLSINGFGHVSIGKMVSPFFGDNDRLVIESGNFVFNGDNGNYDFKVHGDNESNLLYVDASEDMIGIGHAHPRTKLHVKASTGEGTVLSQTDDDTSWAGFLIRDDEDTNVASFQFGNSGVLSPDYTHLRDVLFAGSRESGVPFHIYQGRDLFDDGTANLPFRENNQRIVLDTDGYTRLTAASGKYVHVSGVNFAIGDEGTSLNGAHRVPLSISPTGYAVTATPTAAEQTNKIRVYDREGNGTAGFGVSTSSFNIATSGLIHQRFWTNSNERMRITHDGKVGIRTTTPSSTLHIAGNVKIEEQYTCDLDFNANLYSNQARLRLFSHPYGFYSHFQMMGVDPSTELTFHTNNTERMRVTTAGNVGIGTTLPAFKLDVNGDFSADEINVNSQYTFPTGVGTAGQVIKYPSAGSQLVWADASSNDYLSGVSWDETSGDLEFSFTGPSNLPNITENLDERYPVLGTLQSPPGTINSYRIPRFRKDANLVYLEDSILQAVSSQSNAGSVNILGNIASSLTFKVGSTNAAFDFFAYKDSQINNREVFRVNGGLTKYMTFAESHGSKPLSIGIFENDPEVPLDINADTRIQNGHSLFVGKNSNIAGFALDADSPSRVGLWAFRHKNTYESLALDSSSNLSMNYIFGASISSNTSTGLTLVGSDLIGENGGGVLIGAGKKIGSNTGWYREGYILLNNNNLDVRLQSGTITLNEDANDVNFVVKSNVGNSIYVRGSTGLVGIGTATPLFNLDVNGNFSANSVNVNSAFTFPTVDGSAGQVLKTDGFGNVSWGVAGSPTDNVVSSASFDTGNGVLSLGRTGGLTDVTVDLDGRFSLTDTTYAAGTGLSLLGTTFHANVDATVQTVSHTPVTSTASRTYAVQVDESNDLVVNVPWVDTDTNHYVNSASFNTADGVLTLSRLGLNNVTVDLDGRYQQTLTNPVTGTGAANYVARWSSSNVLSTGIIYDDGTNVGISNTSPNCRLTLGSNITGVFNDGISIDMGGVNKPSFTTRRNTGNPVFSILPYTSQIYLSAGVYYNGSAWIHSSNDVHNCIFTLDPGNGVLWYAGNNGSSISNVASAELLWNTAGIWKNLWQTDEAGHNWALGSLSVGDNHQVNSSKLHLKQDYSTAGGTTSVNAQYVDIDTTSTQNLTNYTIAVHVDARKDVSTGKTDSGYIMGADFNAALAGTSTGTLEGSYGIRTFAGIRDAGTVNNAYGVYSRVLNLGTGTINNGYGIYIHNVNATNSYGLYQSGTDDKNYFAGSVGIGFVNPLYKLDVAGSIRSLLASNNKCVFSTNNIVAKIQPYDATSTTYIGNESNHDLVFRTSNIDRLSIEAAGNVGIGTNNPLYLLDVNGDFNANSINVNSAFTFPTSDGSADQILVTDGAGVLTWEDQPSVVSSSNLTRGSFVVTSTTSLFTVSGGYGTNTLDVYQNGVKLFKGQSPGSYDYQETGGGTSFTLTNPATSGDLIEYVALNASTNAVGNTSLSTVSVTSNQTDFSTTDTISSTQLVVFLNGVKLVEGTSASNADYEIVTSNLFRLHSTAVSGDVVEYIIYGATVASSNLAKTGDTMTGNLTVNADLIVTGYKETHTDNGNTGTAQTIDISDSTVQTYTLNGNCTFNMPAIEAGRSFTMFLKTGAGSFTATFTNVKFPQNSSPTITTDANRMDLITFTCDGTSWYGNAIQDYYI